MLYLYHLHTCFLIVTVPWEANRIAYPLVNIVSKGVKAPDSGKLYI